MTAQAPYAKDGSTNVQNVARAGFEDTDVPPRLFVLMGNFQSDAAADPSAGFVAIRENFNALAALLRTFRLFRVQPPVPSAPMPDHMDARNYAM